MKKILAFGCAAIMLAAAAGFAACGSDAQIKGNYKEPTDEELSSALDSIDAERLFGDPDAAERTFGISANADVTLKMTAQSGSIDMTAGAEYAFLLAEETMTGAGNVTFSLDAEGVKTLEDTSMEAEICNDGDYMYIDAALTEGEKERTLRGKFPFGTMPDLLSAAPDQLPSAPADGAAQTPDIPGLVRELKEAGFEVGLDTADGVKLRIAATEDFFTALEGLSATDGTPMEFTKTVLEIYLYVDSEGLFRQASVFADLAADIKDAENPGTASLNAEIVLKNADTAPVLPDDLDDPQKYPDLGGSGSAAGM